MENDIISDLMLNFGGEILAAIFIAVLFVIVGIILKKKNWNSEDIWAFLRSINKPDYIRCGNDHFAKFTIGNRFPKIYKENILTITQIKYSDGEKIKFDSDDFYNILPDNFKPNNDDMNLIKSFFKHISKYENEVVSFYYSEAEFIYAEHFFYFNILRKLHEKKDPYQNTKKKNFDAGENQDDINRLISECYNDIKQITQQDCDLTEILIAKWVRHCLNANTADLSQIDPLPNAHTNTHIKNTVFILDSQIVKMFKYLEGKKYRLHQVDIVVDNSGIEFLSDMLLSVIMLKTGLTSTVCIHLNILPIFVSDIIQSAYGDDINDTIKEIEKRNEELGKEIRDLIANEKIKIKANLFWNMPNDFKNDYEIFSKLIGNSDLVIIKGDLNFRRLVEDRHWKHTKKFSDLVNYIEYPCLVIRAIKSSVIVGITKEKLQPITNDKANETTGRYGQIMFYEGRTG